MEIGELAQLVSGQGVTGAGVVGLAWFILRIMKQHREERDELVKTLREQNDRLVTVINTGNMAQSELRAVVQEHTAILTNVIVPMLKNANRSRGSD